MFDSRPAIRRHAIILTTTLMLLGCGGGTPQPDDSAETTASAEATSPMTGSSIMPASQRAVSDDAPAGDTDLDDDRTAPTPVLPPAAERVVQTRPDPKDEDGMQAAMTLYGTLLRDVVTADGLVRYDLLRVPRRSTSLNAVVDSIANADLPTAKYDKLALLCNAYNANVLKKVIDAQKDGDFTTVINEEGFFSTDIITVAGTPMTLNELENDHIRPLNDPRIHGALVCAAISCPPLRAEPFTRDRLDAQFDDQCSRWINDASKHRIVGSTIEVSRIFEWYKDDFPDLRGFMRKYAKVGTPFARALRDQSYELSYASYDWTLNQAPEQREPNK